MSAVAPNPAETPPSPEGAEKRKFVISTFDPKGPRDVVRPLKRRKPLVSKGEEFDSPRNYRREVNRTTEARIYRRFFVWLDVGLRFVLSTVWDDIRGRGSRQKNAERLREILQDLGTTTLKIGQQLGVRSDLFPPEYCDELMKLLDEVAPFPTETAIKIIEETQGKPLHEMFAAFDPTPIGSGSIACVYQALLITGEKVAVKVRRPGIEKQFKTDFKVLQMFNVIAEKLGLGGGARLNTVIVECQRMLADEMNLLLEARQAEVFRREAKDRMKGKVTAPRVYHQFSCTQMLVTEFVQAHSMKEILTAIQKNDRENIDYLIAQGYDFKKISRRMLHLFYWETFEAMIFHADLHPANILVRPDNTLVMVDFGCCGAIPPKYKRNLFGFLKSVAVADLTGAVRNMIGLSEPLPPIDIEKYTFEMTSIVREFLVTAHSKHVPWQEKCNGSEIRESLNLARKYGVSMRPELLRYFRANSHMDYMVYRLNPKANPSKQFQKYYHQRAKHARKRLKKELFSQLSLTLDALSITAGDLTRSAGSGLSRLQDFLDSGGFRFDSALKKLPYVFATAASTMFKATLFIGFVTFVKTIHWEITAPHDHTLTFWDHLNDVRANYLMQGLVIFFSLVALKKIVFRLRQADVDD